MSARKRLTPFCMMEMESLNFEKQTLMNVNANYYTYGIKSRLRAVAWCPYVILVANRQRVLWVHKQTVTLIAEQDSSFSLLCEIVKKMGQNVKRTFF